jgi:hypothetical protein
MLTFFIISHLIRYFTSGVDSNILTSLKSDTTQIATEISNSTRKTIFDDLYRIVADHLHEHFVTFYLKSGDRPRECRPGSDPSVVSSPQPKAKKKLGGFFG